MICFESIIHESDSWFDSQKSPIYWVADLIWVDLPYTMIWFDLSCPFLKWVAIIWNKQIMVAKITHYALFSILTKAGGVSTTPVKNAVPVM